MVRGQLADERQGALEHKLVGCRQLQEILQGAVAVNSLEKKKKRWIQEALLKPRPPNLAHDGE